MKGLVLFFLFLNSAKALDFSNCSAQQTLTLNSLIEKIKKLDVRFFSYFEENTHKISCSKEPPEEERGAVALHKVGTFETFVFQSFFSMNTVDQIATLIHESRHNEHHFFDHVSCNQGKSLNLFQGCDQSFNDYGSYRFSYEAYKLLSENKSFSDEERMYAQTQSNFVYTTRFNDLSSNQGRGIYSLWGVKKDSLVPLSLSGSNLETSSFFKPVNIPKNSTVFPIDIEGNELHELLIQDRSNLYLYSPNLSSSFLLQKTFKVPGKILDVSGTKLLIQTPDTLSLYKLALQGLDFLETTEPEDQFLKVVFLSSTRFVKLSSRSIDLFDDKKVFIKNLYKGIFESAEIKNINGDYDDDLIVHFNDKFLLFMGNSETFEEPRTVLASQYRQILLLKHFEPVIGVHFSK